MAKRENFYRYVPSIREWDSLLKTLERRMMRVQYEPHWHGHVLMDGKVVELPAEHQDKTTWIAFNSDGSLISGFPSLVKERKTVVKEYMTKQSKDSSARGWDWSTHRDESHYDVWKIVMAPETTEVTEHLRQFRTEAIAANKASIDELKLEMKEYLDNTLINMGDKTFWAYILDEAFYAGVISSRVEYPETPLGYKEPEPTPEPEPEPEPEVETEEEPEQEITYNMGDLLSRFGKKKKK